MKSAPTETIVAVPSVMARPKPNTASRSSMPCEATAATPDDVSLQAILRISLARCPSCDAVAHRIRNCGGSFCCLRRHLDGAMDSRWNNNALSPPSPASFHLSCLCTSPVRVDRFVIDATEFANAHTSGTTPLQQRGTSTGRARHHRGRKQVQWAVIVDGDGRQIVENPCRADDDRASRSGRYAS